MTDTQNLLPSINQQQRRQHWSRQTLLRSSYQDLGTPETVGKRFQHYLLTNPSTLSSILTVLTSHSTTDDGKTRIKDYSLPIDVHELLSHDPVLGHMLLRHPTTLLPLLEDAVVEAQREVARSAMTIGTKKDYWSSVKGDGDGDDDTRIHARLIHLPPHSSSCRPLLSSLTSLDVGKILQLSGTVVRASKVQMYESQRAFRCCSGSSAGGSRWKKKKEEGCGASFVVKADLLQWNNALCAPSRCPTPSCKGSNFEVIPDGSTRSDYQEIKIQETVSHRSQSSSSHQSRGGSSSGIIPRALLVKLQHDLVDRCQPGDDVVIVGTLISHWQSDLVAMGDVNITTAMHAHSIRVIHGGEAGGDHEGSSWDCIFEQEREEVDDNANDEDKDEGNNAANTAKKRRKLGMVREEIVKEFKDFWNEEGNRKQPMAARNFICQSICPTLYGMSLVKLGLLLTLIGGSRNAGDSDENYCPDKKELSKCEVTGGVIVNEAAKEADGNGQCRSENGDAPVQFHLSDNKETSSYYKGARLEFKKGKRCDQNSQHKRIAVQTRRREQSHLLLVGDPGTGKSQFLRYATALCPRSVLTSGAGTTSAGLTCAAVREGSGKEFTLEAGALVLADRGVCAIDEFSCMDAKDRTSIHEAMEQQTLSVAKAGIVCKLNCRATVIAVTNAKGGIYDHEKTFTSNIGIEPPLLSRFDLIFKLIDGSDPSKDDNVATFLLNRAIQGSGYECTKKTSNVKRKEDWAIEKLRAYIATVRWQFHPSLSKDASELLERHYTACRSSVDSALQVTVRFLESLIRLAQAHARLMYRGIVELDDAVSVITLMESTAANCTSQVHDGSSLFQDPTITVFPEDNMADIDFLREKAKVLEKYHMLNLLSPDETENLLMEKRRSDENSQHALDTWNTVINQNDSLIVVNTSLTIPDNIQDHYGRSQISPNLRSTPNTNLRSISQQSGPNISSNKLSHNWPTKEIGANTSPANLSHNLSTPPNNLNPLFSAPFCTQLPHIEGENVCHDPGDNITSSERSKKRRKRRSAD